jgi:hypothetical protein
VPWHSSPWKLPVLGNHTINVPNSFPKPNGITLKHLVPIRNSHRNSHLMYCLSQCKPLVNICGPVAFSTWQHALCGLVVTANFGLNDQPLVSASHEIVTVLSGGRAKWHLFFYFYGTRVLDGTSSRHLPRRQYQRFLDCRTWQTLVHSSWLVFRVR